MWRDERNTDSRARPLPARRNWKRVRSRRRRNNVSVLLGPLVFMAALLLLAFLAANRLVAILDPLALVGLGRTERADLGGDLADPLAVGAADRDCRRPLASDLHILRDRIDDIVAIAELQGQVAALHGGAIADAVDVEV